MSQHLTALFSALERADPILGGGVTWLAATLLLASAVLVSHAERYRAKMAAWCLFWHLVFVGLLILVPDQGALQTSLRLLASTMVLASLARSAFLLFVHSFWMRRVTWPLPKILKDVIQGVVFAVAFLLLLRSVGVEPGSLLTTSALLTAVIGLSLQDTLGNLFAGLAIQAQRPFDVGDWVKLDAQTQNIGRVIEINWRATRILTLEQLEVTFPNGAVAKSAITNFSRPTKVVRREIDVHAPTDAAPDFVKRVLLAGMSHVREVLAEPAPRVFTKGFTERGTNYVVRYFIQEFQDREVIESAVNDRMWYALTRANITIPAPRRRVEMVQPVASPIDNTEDRHHSVMNLLGQVPLFQPLPAESLQHLASECRKERYTTEEVIVHKGDTSTEMYVIESGRVRIELTDPDTLRTRVLGELGRGDFFGEMSLLTGKRRTADVVAEEETVVLSLDRKALQPVLDQHPELAERISQTLAERQLRLYSAPADERDPENEQGVDQLEILQRIRRFFSN